MVESFGPLENYVRDLYSSVYNCIKGIVYRVIERMHIIRSLEKESPEVESLSLKHIDDINNLLKNKGVDIYASLSLIITAVLRSNDGREGFARGVRLEKPGVPRVESQSLLTRETMQYATRQHGYMIGVLFGVASKYGIILKDGQIPNDDVSHAIFMQGINGEERQPGDKLTALQTLDEQVYLAGHQIRKKIESLQTVREIQGTIIAKVLADATSPTYIIPYVPPSPELEVIVDDRPVVNG